MLASSRDIVTTIRITNKARVNYTESRCITSLLTQSHCCFMKTLEIDEECPSWNVNLHLWSAPKRLNPLSP